MKIKPRKKQAKGSSVKQEADKLGQQYADAAEAIGALEKDKSAANTALKALASKYGIKKGNSHIIEADLFVVGYTEIPSFSVDETLGAKLVNPKLWELCFKRVFDPVKLNDLVEKGLISRKVVERIIQKGPTQQRIIVQKRRNGPQ